ncbi:MAG: hypothetical protein HKN70_02835 [Gammaproteobacteria bacterium]|nr:hypothetical protein [Gammaproteobacteria bacterium]
MATKKLFIVPLGLLVLSFGTTTAAQIMASPNFSIAWDVNDGGGGTMLSSNYTMTDSVMQATAIGASVSTGYQLQAGFFAAPDDDDDGIRSFMDNCIFDFNPTQYDSNGDGYGNLCDPDLDNNSVVNFLDYAPLTSAFLGVPGAPQWNPDADLNGDDIVNFLDISLFPFFFLGTPGPSGLAP